MGGSSLPPFLYDPVSQWSFNDYHRDKSFNPKAITEAYRAPRQERMPQEGPLVNFNRHPDRWVAPRQNNGFTPMSRHTKAWVIHTRRVQLLLRVFSLLGAIGILFCVICISHTDVVLGWIIRVAPSVAILHTVYAIYHLARAAASRPPGSSTSYHLFASVMDAGLVPFYTFTSLISYRSFHDGLYGWETLFNDANLQTYIVKSLFYGSACVGGLHLISFVISIYLAVVFRKIMKLPPDMNPLEDNLTARPSTRRSKLSKSEISNKKHMSTSTIDSAYFSVKSHLDETASDIPQPIPFMHTRQQSFVSSPSSPNRASRISLHSQHQMGQKSPRTGENQPGSPSRVAGQPFEEIRVRPRSLLEDAPVLRPTSRDYPPSSSRWSIPKSPETSGNWVTYESAIDEDIVIHESKMPSRAKNGTPFPGKNIAGNWLGPIPKFGRIESGILPNEARGQYAALENNDPLEDNEERLNTNKYTLEEDITEYLNKALDPLRMNPPTPQPKDHSGSIKAGSRPSSLRRAVLGEISDVSAVRNHNNETGTNIGDEADSTPAELSKLKTFGSLRIWGRKSNPSYSSVKENEVLSSDNDSESETEKSQPAKLKSPKRRTTQGALDARDADRNGRVVSNSGIDLGNTFTAGMDSEQYSEYITALAVGRRRDVSGKIAEEGRGGLVEVTEVLEAPATPEKKQGGTRAAGWARFAGL